MEERVKDIKQRYKAIEKEYMQIQKELKHEIGQLKLESPGLTLYNEMKECEDLVRNFNIFENPDATKIGILSELHRNYIEKNNQLIEYFTNNYPDSEMYKILTNPHYEFPLTWSPNGYERMIISAESDLEYNIKLRKLNNLRRM